MLRQVLENYFNRLWYQQEAKHWMWSPLSRFYEKQARKKRQTFLEIKHSHSAVSGLSIPVLVVGNITVGGTGKTPLTLFLIEQLQQQGFKIAVISRGYGGKADKYPVLLNTTSTPAQVGDEPFMIYQRTGVDVVVDPNRREALKFLSQHGRYDLVISDDGMQHYRLDRQFELAVIDGVRGLGNGACLPLGPLREPAERLNTVNGIVINGEPKPDLSQVLNGCGVKVYRMKLQPLAFVSLNGARYSIDEFKNHCAKNGAKECHAIAAIGNPQRFFNTLNEIGVVASHQSFSDHHPFTLQDLSPYMRHPLVMTEKDAVKVKQVLSKEQCDQVYYLAITAVLDEALIDDIIACFKGE